MFHWWYLVFATLTILPTRLMYEHFWINLLFVAAMITMALWNGANFYIEVFSRKYEGIARGSC